MRQPNTLSSRQQAFTAECLPSVNEKHCRERTNIVFVHTIDGNTDARRVFIILCRCFPFVQTFGTHTFLISKKVWFHKTFFISQSVEVLDNIRREFHRESK